MVDSTYDVGPSSPLVRRAWECAAIVATLIMAATAPGCGVVSQSKMDEAHRLTQNLRAENARLKDVSLDLRARNQDLSQRAVDDSKRLSAQEEIVAQLENSVQAYQAEREKLAEAFDALKQQVRVAINAEPTQASQPKRLESFVEALSGWTYDAQAQVVSIAIDRLFEPGRDRLIPEASQSLKDLGVALSQAETAGFDVLVMTVGTAPPPVEKASFDAQAGQDAKAAARFLATARAARVRERLVGQGSLAPERVKLVNPPAATESSSDDPARSGGRRVEIRLAPRDEGPGKVGASPAEKPSERRSDP